MFEIIPFGRRDRDLFKMFDEFEKSFFGHQPSVSATAVSFRTDVSDKGDSYLLEAELPGFNKEDIAVDVSEGVLTISANRSSEKEDSGKDYVYRERRCGSFKRSFDLSGIDAEGISGEYKDGVLALKLPKEKEQKPESRRIELN